MSENYISVGTCDCCARPGRKGVMFHHLGVAVYFGCRKCQPKNYNSVYRRALVDRRATKV